MLVQKTKKFHEIDPKSWEHPADKAALSALKKMQGIEELIKQLMSVTTERSLKLMALSSSVKVTPTQFPALQRIINDVVDIFDWPYTPQVFVTYSPFWNAGVMGVQEPFIMVHSSMIGKFDEQELMNMIGHEMGHIMSGHVLYKTLLWLLTKVSSSFLQIPNLLILPIIAALYEWERKSELSADRAGLLAIQDPSISYQILMKFSGAEDLSQVNLNDFFLQAQEYEDQKTLIDGIHKLLNQIWLSHPYPVIRLKELKSWESSGDYQSILEGNYLRKGEHQSDTQEETRAGFNYYKDTWKNSDDTLSQVASDLTAEIGKVMEGLGKAAEGIGDSIKDMFKKQ
jgi:Zn-dependent protease with chaperone function